MKKHLKLIILFLVGQWLDFLTTFYARERFKMREFNPLMRKWVEQKAWAKVIKFKTVMTILIFLTICFIFPFLAKKIKKKDMSEKAIELLFRESLYITWLVVLNNLIQIVIAKIYSKKGDKNNEGPRRR